MRFRKRAKLFPGVYLNFSKSGISTTVGVPGASVNFNKQGTFLNTGIPGTGLYDRTKIGGGKKRAPINPTTHPGQSFQNFSYDEKVEIKSIEAEGTTTEGLFELQNTLLECYKERKELEVEISKAESKLSFAATLMIISCIFIFGFFIKWFEENKFNHQAYLKDLKEQLNNCTVNVDMNLPSEVSEKYKDLLERYKSLLSCDRIWDITSRESIDQRATRSAASNSINRKPVKFAFGIIDMIQSSFDALHFENANGGDLYFYPAFIAILDHQQKFGLIDIAELEFNFHGQRFIEEEKVPNDAPIDDYTWAKVNKSGTPDKRFKHNYQIPVCKYGSLKLSSSTGLNEAYLLSSFEKAEEFVNAMEAYQQAIKHHK